MIGLCCQFIEPIFKKDKTDYVNSLKERSLQFKRFQNNQYSEKEILEVYENNIQNIINFIPKFYDLGFSVFRLSSNLLPLIDVVSENIRYNKFILSLLEKLGYEILSRNIRITTHPDQFCVLSSKNPNVISNSINILKYHAWIFDQMKIPKTPYYAINIHGGVKNESSKLIETINNLPENIKNRLTLENDERSFSVKDLLAVSKETNIPIVFDSHHHSFNSDNLSGEDGMDLAISTWNNSKPITHLSNTDPELINGSFTDRRKHSRYVHYIPEYQLKANNKDIIDIDFEFKMKNLSILKAVKDYDIKM